MEGVDIERKINAILRVVSRSAEPVGAVIIARELEHMGIHLDGRTVRYHLKIMDERGLTRKHGREGRTITEKGIRELNDSLVFDRVGYIISKIESLSYQVTFNPHTREGKVIVNTSFVPQKLLSRACGIISHVLDSEISLSNLVLIRKEGQLVGDMLVPEGMACIGTVCSILVNGVLIKEGIPVNARFGGIVEMESGKARRFTQVIDYAGSSTDPLELFMRGGYTSVGETIDTGTGKVLANFREIPASALGETRHILDKLSKAGFNGALAIGRPSQPVLGVNTTPNRCGIAVMGGLNAFAACHESGIDMNTRAISTLADFGELVPVDSFIKGA